MKPINKFLLTALLILTISPNDVFAAWADKQRGFLIRTSGANGWCTEDFRQSVRNLKSIGANLVSLRIAMETPGMRANGFYPYWRTPGDDALACGIDFIRSEGMNFGINLAVNLPPNGGWRARLEPANRDVWFRAMGDYATKYARDFAGPYGASYFSVGTEMYSLVSNEHNSLNAAGPGRYRWPEIIADIRTHYNGPVTYSAQHSGSLSAVFENNDLIPNLDYLGFSGYWPLNASNKTELLAEWNEIEQEIILPAYTRYGKPLALSEIGYRPCSFTFERPWDSVTSCSYNSNAQSLAWDALLTHFADKTYFNGLSGGWYWEDIADSGGTGDIDYMVWGKPAANVIREFWDNPGEDDPGEDDPGGGNPGSCNYLENGSFDAGTAGWVSNVSPRIVSDSVSGGGALSVTGGWVSTLVDGLPNQQYRLTGYGKSSSGAGWAGLGLDFLDGSGNEIGEVAETIRASGTYGRFEIAVTSPANTRSVRLWAITPGGRTLQLDELVLSSSGCDNCNLLSNGNFESGVEDWLASNTQLQRITDGSNSQWAMRFGNGSASVVVPAVAGANYRFSGNYKTSNSSAWTGAGIDFLGNTGQEFDEDFGKLSSSSNYRNMTLSVTAPAGTAYLRLWLVAGPGKTLTVDNLRFINTSCNS